MRDISRIYDFCNKLAGVWAAEFSDLRFGQLISNVFDEIKKDDKDPFYLEENEILEYVENYLDLSKNEMKRNLQLDELSQFDNSNKNDENSFNK